LNVVDTAALKVLKVIALPTGSRPMKVLVASNGQKIYVSTGRAGTVSVLDSHTYEVLNTIKVGVRPWGMAFSPRWKVPVHREWALKRCVRHRRRRKQGNCKDQSGAQARGELPSCPL
jgi:YVTN family beta-propeller protein